MKFLFFFILCCVYTSAQAQKTESIDKSDVKAIVEELLHAKDKTIEALDARIKKLEQLTQQQKQIITNLQQEKRLGESAEPSVVLPESPGEGNKSENGSTIELSLLEKFFQKTDSRTDAEQSVNTEIGGFFDVTAQTKSNDNQIFHLGVVELDFDRIFHAGHFAASVALDWFPYAVEPVAQVGAAFIDFHLYDDAVPLRGRIFQEPGFHIQAGQFDLPFASDYQFYAVTDRLTVTPPLTTTRIQQSGSNPANGGLNSVGARTYGQWRNLSYAAYAVDSVFSDGLAIGGRVGYLVNDPYRMHKRNGVPILDAGLSILLDMDKTDETTDKLYAADLSFSYENFRLVSEYIIHDANRDRTDGAAAYNETSYHVTLFADLEEWLKHSLYIFGRYQEWNPDFRSVEIDDSNYKVNRIEMISVGLGYRFNDYITLKAEYNDTLDAVTEEPFFQKRFGIIQLVGSF